ncbi:TonB-dependent receptor [Ferrimonas lipolytica]|uniref:TonB-dependent receptor n=1 Tax=Ferrimonas lipolytica TaxID=2724191 RepID=A0A6H1UDW4_9GAMM|nr:TonB-dependent receptor [Ferrimonas lipolytica]QIZ77297.1 TonB-dependent receptor [Ferrimonas lipolytica]
MDMMSGRISIIAAAVIMAMPVMAEQSTDFGDIEDVIVVRGEAPTAQQLATTSYTIDADAIAQQGALSLDQVLATVPGVFVRTGGQGRPLIDIRGFKTRHALLLINGVPANASYDGQFDTRSIPASRIERVVVSMGPSSLLYGNGGNAGIINVITKRGNDDAPTVAAQVGGGNDGRWLADVSAATQTDATDFMISYSGTGSDGSNMPDDFDFSDNEDGGRRDNSDDENHKIYSSAGWQVNSATKLALTVEYQESEWGIPSSLEELSDNKSKSKYERIDEQNSGGIQLSGDHQLNGNMALRGYVYYNQLDEIANAYEDGNYETITETTDSRSKNQGANLQFLIENGAHLFTTAFIYENQRYQASLCEPTTISISGDGSGGGSGGGSGSGGGDGSGGGSGDNDSSNCSNSSHSMDLYNVVAEYQWQPTQSYGATAGASWHYNDISKESDYSGLVSGYLYLTDVTKLSTSVARKVRFATLKNLFEPSKGNEDLEAEVTEHLEIGLAHQFNPSNQVELSLYHSDIDNYIEKDELNGNIYRNFAKYRFQGVDATWRNRDLSKLDIDIAYSYLDAENRDPEDSSRDQLQNRPKHQIQTSFVGYLPWDITTRLDASWVMDVVDYYENKDKEMVKIDSGDYTVVDLTVSQPLPMKGWSWQAGITNLLDEEYSQSVDLLSPGREWLVSIKAEF